MWFQFLNVLGGWCFFLACGEVSVFRFYFALLGFAHDGDDDTDPVSGHVR